MKNEGAEVGTSDRLIQYVLIALIVFLALLLPAAYIWTRVN